MSNEVFGFVILIVSFALYMAPTIIAIEENRTNTVAIGALNLFLGWTIVGWVVSLVWALSHDEVKERRAMEHRKQY